MIAVQYEPFTLDLETPVCPAARTFTNTPRLKPSPEDPFPSPVVHSRSSIKAEQMSGGCQLHGKAADSDGSL